MDFKRDFHIVFLIFSVPLTSLNIKIQIVKLHEKEHDFFVQSIRDFMFKNILINTIGM